MSRFRLVDCGGLDQVVQARKTECKATEGLLHKSLNFAFVLGLLIVIGDFAKSFIQCSASRYYLTQRRQAKPQQYRDGFRSATNSPLPSPPSARGGGNKKPR